LEGSAFSCVAAMDAVQATSIALRQKPQLILLDIGLPGGSGLVLLDRLRTNIHTNAIPTIVVTAQTKPGLEAMVRAKGAVGFIQKPIGKEDFTRYAAACPGTIGANLKRKHV
jgi:putative two-component system response regulator